MREVQRAKMRSTLQKKTANLASVKSTLLLTESESFFKQWPACQQAAWSKQMKQTWSGERRLTTMGQSCSSMVRYTAHRPGHQGKTKTQECLRGLASFFCFMTYLTNVQTQTAHPLVAIFHRLAFNFQAVGLTYCWS